MSNVRYSLSSWTAKKTGGRLHYVSKARCEADWHSTPHTHTHTELFYVTGGCGRFEADGDSFEVGEDDVVIVNPSVPHTEFSYTETPLEYVVLGIEGAEFSRKGGGGYLACRCSMLRQDIRFYLNDMLRELQEHAPRYEETCQSLFEVLLIKVARCIDNLLSSEVSEKTNRECGAVKRYLDTNYKENITLDSLAQMTHINKYYLAHAFRRYTGMSPISYLLGRRMEESRSLLETTDYSISQIAGITGFSSQSYFSQMFRKNTGETPNEYRKRVKGAQTAVR